MGYEIRILSTFKNVDKDILKDSNDKLNSYGSMIMKLQLPEGCKDFSDYYLRQFSDNG